MANILWFQIVPILLSVIFFQAAKMAKYAGYQKLCDTIFAAFTVLWIVTRVGVYPFWIIRKYVPDTTKSDKTLLMSFFLQYLNWSTEISPDVSRLLHIQRSFDSITAAAYVLDVLDT